MIVHDENPSTELKGVKALRHISPANKRNYGAQRLSGSKEKSGFIANKCIAFASMWVIGWKVFASTVASNIGEVLEWSRLRLGMSRLV